MAGPLDELVKRILRRADLFKEEHEIDEVEVRIELIDGSLHRLQTLSAEPGFGFVSFRPHDGERPGGGHRPARRRPRDPDRAARAEQSLGFAGSPPDA